MENYYDENMKAKKRGSKRTKKNKTEQEEVIPQKRSRQRRDTLTRQELEKLRIFAEETSETPTSFMSTTQATSEVSQPSYSMQPPLPSYPQGTRAAEMPTSSTYPSYSRSSRATSTVTSSELTRALEIPLPSVSYTTHTALPKTHVPATVKMLEKTAIQRNAKPQYAAQAMPDETATYHTVAERTRAATKMLRSRMEFIHRTASESSIHSTSEAVATGAVSTTTSSATPMQHPEVTPSYYLRQRQQPRSAVGECNLRTPTPQMKNKYWIYNNTTITLASKSLAQAKDIQAQGIKLLELVQTDLTISPLEGNLLSVIRTKQLQLSNINIIEGNEYTVTYTQVQRKKVKSNTAYDTLMRSSNILKSSLIDFYSKTIQQSNVTEVQANSANNGNDVQDKETPADLAQNVKITDAPKLLQALLGTPKLNDDCNRSTMDTKNTQNRSNPPRAGSPQDQRYQNQNFRGHQHFTNYTNNYTRYFDSHFPGCRYPHFGPGMGLHHPAQFFRYMDPRYFPSAARQTFMQFNQRMSGWF